MKFTDKESRKRQCETRHVYAVFVVVERVLEDPRVVYRPRGDSSDVDHEYGQIDHEEDGSKLPLAGEFERTSADEYGYTPCAHVDCETAARVLTTCRTMRDLKEVLNCGLTSTSTIDSSPSTPVNSTFRR